MLNNAQVRACWRIAAVESFKRREWGYLRECVLNVLRPVPPHNWSTGVQIFEVVK